MLTKLTVKGFKNLRQVSVEFGAFTCIAGANAAGKSNLFDVMEFLCYLADEPLMRAAQMVRGTDDGRSADPRDLFWNGHGPGDPSPIHIVAEMIVPPSVEDDFGQTIEASITFLEYSVTIGYQRAGGRSKFGRLELLHEGLKHINLGEGSSRLRFPHSAKEWRSAVLTGRRSGTAFISTEGSGEDRKIKIHQDGGSRGQPRVAAAAGASATVVGTTTQTTDPTILAARREMQSWKRLSLVPTSLRSFDCYSDPQSLGSDGRHLAATLHRICLDSQQPSRVRSSTATPHRNVAPRRSRGAYGCLEPTAGRHRRLVRQVERLSAVALRQRNITPTRTLRRGRRHHASEHAWRVLSLDRPAPGAV